MSISKYLLLVWFVATVLVAYDRVFSRVESSELLDTYVGVFKTEMTDRDLKLDFSDIDVKFKPYLGDDITLGICFNYPNKKYVRILKKYWIAATPEIKEAILSHELGHAFGLHHNEEMKWFSPDNKLCPESIMYPTNIMSGCLNRYRSYYYNELATNIKKYLDK